MTKPTEIEAKSILVKSKLPDADYVVNPYTGCQFGCLYCYASFMGRFVGESINNWGNYVYVKRNAVNMLEKELKRWAGHRLEASILLSSVTDPYQGVEKDYRLTRGILEALCRTAYPGPVSILTKSPLVLRDVDILQQMPDLEVGMTVTTTDDRLSRFLEVRAPLASRRLNTLKQLKTEGIYTYAFIGPLLPHFRYLPDLLDELFGSVAKTGIGSIYVEHMNLNSYIKKRLWQVLRHESLEVQRVYLEASTILHREALNNMVAEIAEKYGLKLRMGGVLYHYSNNTGSIKHKRR